MSASSRSLSRQTSFVVLTVLVLIWTYVALRHQDYQQQHRKPPHYHDDLQPPSSSPESPTPPSSPPPPPPRPLVLYAYKDSPVARENLAFFVDQGLHGAADFVFIINGGSGPEADPGVDAAAALIPANLSNVAVVRRPNTCFDLGAYGEVLRSSSGEVFHRDEDGGDVGDSNAALYTRYRRFVMLNASVRGPFVPHWSRDCWTDLYTRRLSDKVKLVGMTVNCWPRFHVQSMIWATDEVGIRLLLFPPPPPPAPSSSSYPSTSASSAPAPNPNDDPFGSADDPVGLAGCYDSWHKAVHAEAGTTVLFQQAGYAVDVMMAAFHGSAAYYASGGGGCVSRSGSDTAGSGGDGIGDVLFNGAYFGGNVHPYETLFIKTNRNIDPEPIAHLTEWHLARGSTSWDVCGGTGGGSNV